MRLTRLAMVLAAAAALCSGADETPSLTTVRRIFVDRLTGESSIQIRDMLINSLQATRRFVVTENPDKADATLRGSAEDLIYTDTFQQSDSVNARVSVGRSTASTGGLRMPGASVGVGDSESTKIAERKHEATAAVRLVNRDGDVIWATTQESAGAKFRGASADVADRVVKQLLADIEKARTEALPAKP